ncbi:MAG: OsmC family protein [Acidimicrobiia bacterium]
MTQAQTREYVTTATSTRTLGRVICTARDHLFVADGPVPGVAITPGELFLTSIAACAVELIQVLARDRDVPLRGVQTQVRGVLGGDTRVHREVTVFDSVHLGINLEGVSQKEAAELVEGFKSR